MTTAGRAPRRRIYLMRHGAVEYFDARGVPVGPAPDVRLTAEGREQATAAGVALRDAVFDRVVTSGLPRTVETADLVVAQQRVPLAAAPETWPELEELRGGRLDDIPDDELEEAFLGAFRGVAPRATRYTGGETIGELVDRVLPALDRLLGDRDWTTALLVLHGGVNRAIVSRALSGQPVFFGHLEQSPACINVLDVGEHWVVRGVNITPYDLAHVGATSTSLEQMLDRYAVSRTP
jgi:broad specificity phosphatase PhoE